MRGKFEIEDLSSERWSKIKRNVLEGLEREDVPRSSPQLRVSHGPRRAIVTFVLAGAAAAVIGAVAWEKLRPGPHAGEASNVSRVSADDAPSHVQLGENAVDVGTYSSVSIRGSDAAGFEITLDHGEIECEVAPRRGRPPFVVVAGDVRVVVVGTHFHVVRAGKATNVSVQRGTVEVDEHESVTLVHAGGSWPPSAVVPPPTTPSSITTTPPAATATQVIASQHATGPTRRERYEKALAVESSQADASLATYRELATGSDAWAMNALFAEARLEHERGHKDEARRLSTEYLARFPTGPNARDARELAARVE